MGSSRRKKGAIWARNIPARSLYGLRVALGFEQYIPSDRVKFPEGWTISVKRMCETVVPVASVAMAASND